jgi:hypothetical protein
MGDLEIPDHVIGLVLDHAPIGVTARYSRSRRETEIARALGLWATRLEEILHGHAPAENVVRFEEHWREAIAEKALPQLRNQSPR